MSKDVPFIVGQDVRVENLAKTLSTKAMVSFINDDNTLDVIYGSKGGNNDSKDEESSIALDRVHCLEPFEVHRDDVNTLSGETLKEYGNKLFAVKDYRSALDWYKRALIALTHTGSVEKLSVGSIVLVSRDKSIDYYVGMVSDVVAPSSGKTSLYEVMYDQDNEYNEELETDEETVSKDRLTVVSSDIHDRATQRAVYLNMARSYLKLNEPGWAVKTSSIALFITLYILGANQGTAVSVSNKHLVDAYYFRAKALLSVNRPGFASKVWSTYTFYTGLT